MKKINKPELNKTENLETKINYILAGIFMNGFIQGKAFDKMDDSVLMEAKKEMKKIIKKLKKNYEER